jgi:DNA polymerase-3 subunit delta'
MANTTPYPWQMPQWQNFTEQLQTQRLPHALLLQGEQCIGKARLAESLAALLLCKASKEGADFACGQCKTCQLFNAGTHPDFLQVGLEEKSKQIKVDQIRQLVDFVSKTSQMQGRKVIIIEPAESMNINAANALLKSLEEPTAETYILLVSHAPKRLLPTIRSRCQTVALYKPSLAESDQWLATFLQDINLRKQLLQLAAGNPLLAFAYHERELLALYKQLIDQRISYKTGNGDAVKFAALLDKSDVLDVLLLQQHILWQLIQAGLKTLELSDSPLVVLKELYQSAGFVQKAYKLLEEIQQAQQQAQGVTNPNILLLLESLEIRWQALLRQRPQMRARA